MNLTDWAVDLMNSLGGPGAFLVVGADNLFPPIPSELVLPLAGFSASRGTFSVPEALAWTTAGSVAGAVIVYVLGALLGRARTRALVARIPLMKARDFDRSEAWFARHGSKAVLFGRMIPLFRSVISLPAGVARMGFAKFLALTAVGSLIWNTVFVAAGYALGANWQVVNDYADVIQKVVIAAVVVAVVLFVIVRVRGRRERGAQRSGHRILNSERSRGGVGAEVEVEVRVGVGVGEDPGSEAPGCGMPNSEFRVQPQPGHRGRRPEATPGGRHPEATRAAGNAEQSRVAGNAAQSRVAGDREASLAASDPEATNVIRRIR